MVSCALYRKAQIEFFGKFKCLNNVIVCCWLNDDSWFWNEGSFVPKYVQNLFKLNHGIKNSSENVQKD
ncbi:hypothetical protein BpHYR1_012347 [Brachionus plicatilis]|uniref:Uncharacterized protein n=1 Tax=Brachionus plicatilis TaxID=10195 RepID=A0A3M7PMY0_BRAPC|nr:hypothetical protein BpHYR1_012347 [Brachionus plicatilis]